ncbi:long-chain-fatty-acid--CoA ligase 1, partial [Reticulomyxa filosa]
MTTSKKKVPCVLSVTIIYGYVVSLSRQTIRHVFTIFDNLCICFFYFSDTVTKIGLLGTTQPTTTCHYWLEIPDEEDPFNIVYRSLPKYDDVRFSFHSTNFLKSISNSIDILCDLAQKKKVYENFSMCMSVRERNNNLTFRTSTEKCKYTFCKKKTFGKKKGNETRVGICMANRPEWVLTDYACHTQGFVSIPLYDTLAKNAIEYIINHAGVVIVFCDVKTIGEVIAAKKLCPTLKYVVVCNDWPTDKEWLQKNSHAGFTHQFTELEAIGANKRVSDVFCSPNDLATICYTSGTTGDPKGAMLTHKNVMTALTAFRVKIRHYVGVDDSAVSFLPLAHAYEKLMELFFLDFGVKIGYWRGDATQLLEDIQMVKPTIFAG